VILRECQFFPGLKQQIHRFCVACDFLLIARFERMPLQIGEQGFDLSIGELDAFDACRRPDAFDHRYVAQCPQPFRRQRPQCFPTAFELIDFGDQLQHFV